MLNRRETLGMTAALGLLHGVPALAAVPNRSLSNQKASPAARKLYAYL